MNKRFFVFSLFAALPLSFVVACTATQPNNSTTSTNVDAIEDSSASTSTAMNQSSSPTSTPSTTANTTPPTTTSSTIRINAGGNEYKAADGNVWSADYGYDSNSSTYNVSDAVANTQDQTLYQSERYGDEVVYNIPASNGRYTINLHFAEGYWTRPNQRLITIDIEDRQVENRFDIVAQAGSAHRAVIKTYTADVADGVLTVRLRAVETGRGYHATIQGLEITKQS